MKKEEGGFWGDGPLNTPIRRPEVCGLCWKTRPERVVRICLSRAWKVRDKQGAKSIFLCWAAAKEESCGFSKLLP